MKVENFKTQEFFRNFLKMLKLFSTRTIVEKMEHSVVRYEISTLPDFLDSASCAHFASVLPTLAAYRNARPKINSIYPE